MKKRYFLYFSYNGKAYHGWQMQPNGISVQEMLMRCVSTILRAETELTGAGRTDTGVHAKTMVAHFETENSFVADPAFVIKLNSMLPHDIACSKVLEVQPDAHARFDAISRRYEYHIVTQKDVFLKDLAVRMPNPLDFAAMNIAAEKLLHYTDFTSFSKLHTDVKTNNCDVKSAQWHQIDAHRWYFSIEADRFLRNMVRAIVGTLFDVGRAKLTVEQFEQVIQAKNRCQAGASVPAHGLYLVDIVYPEDVFV